MITIGLSKTFDSTVERTIWIQKQLLNFELNENGVLDQELEIFIHFNEDKESEEKEITFVDVGGDITVGRNVGEHVDHLEELSNAIGDWFDKMTPEEMPYRNAKLSGQVFEYVENHITEQGMEWANA